MGVVIDEVLIKRDEFAEVLTWHERALVVLALHSLYRVGEVFKAATRGLPETHTRALDLQNCARSSINRQHKTRMCRLLLLYRAQSQCYVIAELRMHLRSFGHRLLLQQVTFDWKREARENDLFTQKQTIGFVAQEVDEVFPELVQRYGFDCVSRSGR